MSHLRPVMAMLLLALLALAANGCATRHPDEESDIPWNAPQSWEGAPYIPGLESR